MTVTVTERYKQQRYNQVLSRPEDDNTSVVYLLGPRKSNSGVTLLPTTEEVSFKIVAVVSTETADTGLVRSKNAGDSLDIFKRSVSKSSMNCSS